MDEAGLIDALDEALFLGRPSGDLAARALEALAGDRDAAEADVLAALLAERAVLAGDVAAAEEMLARLPRVVATGHRAALLLAAGDVRRANALADEVASGPTPDLGASAAPLALLLLARDAPPATRAAKRILGATSRRGSKETAGALRKLVAYLQSGPEKHERIDVHRMRGAAPWQLLLSALNVALHVHASTTRASWAHVLVEKCFAWTRAGYAWLGRQALFFAHAVDEVQCRKELADRGERASDLLAIRPGEIDLATLVTPKPPWERGLEALAKVAAEIESTTDVDHRVAWHLEMSDGTFAKPALQVHRPGAGGWTQGQRVELEELWEVRHLLPAEDVRVLEASRETLPGRRALTPEAYEALVDHPRAVNGARGGARVEVARGVGRLVVEEDGGWITLRVEPEGAQMGINVRVENEARLVVYRVGRAMARVIEAVPRALRVPKARAHDVSTLLDALGEGVEIESADRGAERRVPADSTPCVRFSTHAGAWLVEMGVQPFGGGRTEGAGRFFVAGVGRASIHYHDGGRRVQVDRDLALEIDRAARLVASSETLVAAARDAAGRGADEAREATYAWVLGEAEVLALLVELSRSSEPHALLWRETRLALPSLVTAKRLGVRLRSIKGWYLATGGYRINDLTDVTIAELARAPALAGGRFVRLPTGDWVEIEERVRRVLAVLRRVGDRIPPAAIAPLAELADPASGVETDEPVRAWLARAEAASRADADVPSALAATLRPYQIEGFRWMARLASLGIGACLADDMGLGKTVQVLAFLLSREAGPHLVVAPTTVCGNWAREIARFAPSLRGVELTGKDRARRLAEATGPATIFIVSYALLVEDADELAGVAWGAVVLDEAQFVKNPETERARAAFRLMARDRVALTGTPIENHFGDLWSLFHFLNPGLLGTWKDFQRRFVRPVDRAADRAPEVELRAWVRPYVLRRLKADVLSDLPPITELQHDVFLTKDESIRYALLRKQIHAKLFTPGGKRGSKIEILAEITRLRRFCCHPRLVFPDADADGSKLGAFLDLATELRENGHRALVFSQYVDFLTIVREALDERGLTYAYLDGSTPQAQRRERVDAFQAGEGTLFLATLRAGGFGVNLTAADYVIHLDPWWNPAVLAQATDRAHRIGQARPVTAYTLIAKHTIEEQIVALQARKQRLSDAVLDGASAAAELSIDDLLGMLRDP